MNAQIFSQKTYNRITSIVLLVALLATMAVFPAQAMYIGVTDRVSVTQEGDEGDGHSYSPSISADGHFVAFHSSASNFSGSDSGGSSDTDVFVKDRISGELFHVTSDSTVIAKNGSGPSISGNGQLIAFTRRDYSSGDYYHSVLTYNRQTGATVAVCEVMGSKDCGGPIVSSDGRFTTFDSTRTNLVAGDTNGKQDIFVFNNQTHQTVRVSVASDGTQANDDSRDPSLSADGRFVAFRSAATNLVSGDANGRDDVFVHDITTGQTVAVSLKQDGTLGGGSSPSISAGGRYVAFYATDFLPEDFNGYGDVYVFDRDFDEDGVFDESGEVKTIVASVGYDGRLGNASSGGNLAASLSADGRFIAFESTASNLVPIDTNGDNDVFVHDRDPDEDGIFDEFGETTTFRVSVASDGSEADGVSLNPSISAGGAFVAFRSNAPNLVSGDANGRIDIFVREIQGVAYTVSGRVRDLSGIGIAGVTIAAGRMGSTVTDSGGFYHLTLRQGAYDLVASKDGYSFTPPTQPVELTQDLAGVDFVGVPVSAPFTPFLDVPFEYVGGMWGFEQATRNHNNGDGWVQSWFDHKLPNYSEKNGTGLWLYGRVYAQNPEWKDGIVGGILGFDDHWYDGHDALDFAGGPFEVLSAAAGTVAEVCQGSCWRGPTYGNYVVINHENGYATHYAHLASIQSGISVGVGVSQGQQLGIMGHSGGDFGVHLHFAVMYDANSDGQWTADEVVDPFGWRQPGIDPWVTAGGPVSHRLWKHWTGDERTFVGDELVLLQNTPGTIRSLIGVGTWDGQVTLQLEPGPVASPSASLRSIGRSFWEILLEFFGFGGASGQGVSAMDADPFAPTQPITQTVTYTDQEVRHINESSLALYWWDETAGAWQQLPSNVNVDTNTVVATTMALGQFDVQGPLVCPADTTEIDDSYFAASPLTVGTLATRWLDIADDEDWLRFDAELDQAYVISVTNLAAGVSANLEVYDLGGTTILASDLDGGEASIQWTAPVTGTHFLRVSPALGSATGCGASYDVAISEATEPPPPTGSTIYLPIVLK